MKYCHLRSTDVLMRDGIPIFVVLESDPERNVFRWFSLLSRDFGQVGSPDFEHTKMWDESVFDVYDKVLRGDVELT